MDQVFEFIIKKCVKNGGERYNEFENRMEKMRIKDHEVDGEYLTLDQASTLQWCEFYLENNLTLNQVPFVSFEMLCLSFRILSLIINMHGELTRKQ